MSREEEMTDAEVAHRVMGYQWVEVEIDLGEFAYTLMPAERVVSPVVPQPRNTWERWAKKATLVSTKESKHDD